jgi:hypothetical protein
MFVNSVKLKALSSLGIENASMIKLVERLCTRVLSHLHGSFNLNKVKSGSFMLKPKQEKLDNQNNRILYIRLPNSAEQLEPTVHKYQF